MSKGRGGGGGFSKLTDWFTQNNFTKQFYRQDTQRIHKGYRILLHTFTDRIQHRLNTGSTQAHFRKSRRVQYDKVGCLSVVSYTIVEFTTLRHFVRTRREQYDFSMIKDLEIVLWVK